MDYIVQAIEYQNYIIAVLSFAAGVTFRDLIRLLGWLFSKLETTENDIMPSYKELKSFRDGEK